MVTSPPSPVPGPPHSSSQVPPRVPQNSTAARNIPGGAGGGLDDFGGQYPPMTPRRPSGFRSRLAHACHMHTCTHTCTHTHTYTHTHVCTHTCTHTHTHTHSRMHTRMYTHTYTCTHTHICKNHPAISTTRNS